MTELFQTVLDRTLSASWLVLAILAARLALKKAPRWIICSLWALVAVRLMCPVSMVSTLSLMPEVEVSSMEVLSEPAAYALPGKIAAVESAPLPSEGDLREMESESYFYATVKKPDGTQEIVGPIESSDVKVSWLDVCATPGIPAIAIPHTLILGVTEHSVLISETM